MPAFRSEFIRIIPPEVLALVKGEEVENYQGACSHEDRRLAIVTTTFWKDQIFRCDARSPLYYRVQSKR